MNFIKKVLEKLLLILIYFSYLCLVLTFFIFAFNLFKDLKLLK